MRLTTREGAIITIALREYRSALEEERLVHSCTALEVNAILEKLEQAAADNSSAEAYQGIGERKGVCFCRTCRTILEGQLRDVLTRLPDDQRRDVVDRIEGSLTDGPAS